MESFPAVIKHQNSRQLSSTKDKHEILQTFPVLCILLFSLCLYSIFWTFHLLPNLRYDLSKNILSQRKFIKVLIETIAIHLILVMFWISFVLSIAVSPGHIPDTERWIQGTADEDTPFYEHKKEGTQRYCKWCKRYKPDRAHHCRQCKRCILKMDHHCPWIYNCVGWGNHKYFVLSVFYGFTCSTMVACLQFNTVVNVLRSPKSEYYFARTFLLIFGEVLACILAIITGLFFIFHIWLITQNLSTIEFCEKFSRRPTRNNIYNLGIYHNVKQALGPNFILWLIPIDNRLGNGISFCINTEKTHLLSGEAAVEKESY